MAAGLDAPVGNNTGNNTGNGGPIGPPGGGNITGLIGPPGNNSTRRSILDFPGVRRVLRYVQDAAVSIRSTLALGISNKNLATSQVSAVLKPGRPDQPRQLPVQPSPVREMTEQSNKHPTAVRKAGPASARQAA